VYEAQDSRRDRDIGKRVRSGHDDARGDGQHRPRGVGPRTPDHLHSSLAGAGTELSADILDRIDEIVPPGTEVNPDDNHYTPPATSNCAPGSAAPRAGTRRQ
jgi:hypothetical protein